MLATPGCWPSDMVRTDRHNHRPVASDSEDGSGGQGCAGPGPSVHDLGPGPSDQRAAVHAAGALPGRPGRFRRSGQPRRPRGAANRADARRAGAGLCSRAKIAGGVTPQGPPAPASDERAMDIHTALRVPQLSAPAAVSTAMGASVAASVAVIATMVAQIAALATELEAGFDQHPDAQVVRSLPGLGTILGGRVLGELGDEPNRHASAKSRKNHAGTSPITRASGTKKVVLARHVRNHRLADAIYLWAFAALSASPGARAFYDQHRAAGDTHHAALRALGNRLVGFLHGCLEHHSRYDEHIAWGHRDNKLPARGLTDASHLTTNVT